MVSQYQKVQDELTRNPKFWLVTGAAGFIGSHLLETLLKLGQKVRAVDNFATGYQHNLEDVERSVGVQNWKNCEFIEGDITQLDLCRQSCVGIDYILHQAALGSVPRSIEDPIRSNKVNADGYLNMLVAARDAKVKRFVYASSSSVYGDSPELPKVETKIGKQLSPYAVTKYINELYMDVFGPLYNMEIIGLRYFNIFGPRQDPNGAYAAVIPRWIGALLSDEAGIIYGDGKTSRDFCYVANAVQANILAAVTAESAAIGRAFNVAVSEQTDLNSLFSTIVKSLKDKGVKLKHESPKHLEFRLGDVRHSLADISLACSLLGYAPAYRVNEGLAETISWYVNQERKDYASF